jgi:hypothetical protein
MGEEILFMQAEIFSVLERQKAAIKQRILDIPANKLLNASEHDIVDALLEEWTLHVPALNDDAICITDIGEADIDVSQDPMRIIMDRSRPVYIRGNKTVISVPFVGEKEFFKIQPATWGAYPVRALICEGELLFIRQASS